MNTVQIIITTWKDLCVLSRVKLSNTHQFQGPLCTCIMRVQFGCGGHQAGLMIARYQRQTLIKIDTYSIYKHNTQSAADYNGSNMTWRFILIRLFFSLSLVDVCVLRELSALVCRCSLISRKSLRSSFIIHFRWFNQNRWNPINAQRNVQLIFAFVSDNSIITIELKAPCLWLYLCQVR